MSIEELDDKIERYVLDLMDSEEKHLFEKERKEHPEWEELINLNKLLFSTLNPERIKFHNKLKDINSKNSKYKIDITKIGIILLTATSVLILIYILKFKEANRHDNKIIEDLKLDSLSFKTNTLQDKIKVSNDTNKIINDTVSNNLKMQLYSFANNEIYDPYIQLNFRVFPDSTENINSLDVVINKYIKKDYKNALVKINDLSDTIIDKQFLKSLILFKIHKYSEAFNILNDIKRDHNIQDDIMDWNKLMCLMSENKYNSKDVKELLSRISKSNSSRFKIKAIKLQNILYGPNIPK